nr:MAG TPA: Large polyvalent protein associated domain 29 [Bacteriophage sp.]
MKATFNEIIENLVKVLTDKAESAQYYSDNEQYICLCGWCGIMSPVSRPAYVKTFGKDTTEQAEAKAREIIAEKEAARQRTKYAEHAREADRLEGVPAVGGFFWADNSGLKCDGGRGLFEELHALNYYTDAQNTPARLCCVEQIIKVSDDDFARPGLADELVTRYNLQGFARSEDVDDNDNTYNNNPEKLATFYTVGTLVVSPSGKYYLIDSEGYNYARYIYVPIEWPVMLADEVAAVKAKEEARKAEEERQAAEEKAQRLADYRARCAKWSPLMRNVEKMEQEGKATARKIDNARKANILAMCAAAFPGVKFSVSVRRGWGADFELTWTDGPTVEEFNEKTDLSLFCRCRDTFDGWDDSTGVDYAEFADFARLTMGSNGGDIKATREMSDEARAELLAQIFAAVPAADNRNKYGYTDAYTYTNKEAEAVAAALGVGVFDIFAYGYAENAETIARRAWDKHSYTKTTTPEPTDPTPGKHTEERTENTEAAPAQDAAQTDDAPAEGLQLVETAEGVAVIGDSRTTYRNRKAIKAHGATWNKEAKQWQASEPEAVARLREWFGVSGTPTAEEGDTAHESEPQSDDTDRNEPTEHTHTTESTPTASTAPASLLYEADEITATAPTDTAEDFADVLAADRLKLLRYVAADLRQNGRNKNPLDALRARLYALNALGVDVYDLMTLAASIPPESVGERSATSCALEAIQRLSSTADRRAAQMLTPEEWCYLFGTPHPKQHAAA